MATIKAGHPYQVVVHANDRPSGKIVTNTWVWMARPGGTAYGDSIVGSSLATLIASFRTRFRAQILPLLTDSYRVSYYQALQVVGWTNVARTVNVSSAMASPTAGMIRLKTASAHRAQFGSAVTVAGLVVNTNTNGARTVAAVISPTEVDIAIAAQGVDVAVGTLSVGSYRPRYTFDDNALLNGVAADDTGAVADDTLPIHSTVSVRKITEFTGRKRRGGIRFSCIPEGANIDGNLTGTARGAWQDAMDAMTAQLDIGGASALPQLISSVLSFSGAQTYVEAQAANFMKEISNYVVSPNEGSMVRRKPKLSQPIVPI